MNKTVLIGLSVAAMTAATPAMALNISLNADIRSLDPGVNRDLNSDAVVMHMVEGLVAYGEDAAVKPLLASAVEMSEDGRSYTFTLRPGIRFHNGETLTSQDVLWSWNRYMDEATEWRCRADFAPGGLVHVTGVEAPSEDTVIFTLAEPKALFLATLARTDCGMTGIMDEASLDADGNFVQPIGTGPYMLGTWRNGEYIELNAFPDYVSLEGERDGYTGGKRPLVDTVRFVVIPDASAASAALLSGAIDVVPDASYTDIERFRTTDGIELSITSNPGITALLLQTRDPLLEDVRIRRAIAMAIDTEELTQGVTLGLTHANNSVVPQTSPYSSATTRKGYDYDPATAAALLAEAGYGGQPITLLTNTRYPNSYDAAVIAQAMLQGAGINAQLEVLEWATQLDRYQTGNYAAMSFPYSARFDPTLSFDSVMGNKDEQPRKVWDHPEAQALLEESFVVSDTARRQEIFDELHEIFLDTVPFVMLFNATEASAYRTSVENYRSSIFSMPRAWEVTTAE